MTDTIFYRLLDGVNRPSRLSAASAALRRGEESADAYSTELGSLRQVPGSPFAYRVSNEVRELFVSLNPLESSDIHACKGPDTGDDFRFLRASWEVGSGEVGESRRWVDHPKGGEYSQFYSDVHLLIDWHTNGNAIRCHGNMRNPGYFFRPGLTWSRRTTSNLSLRLMSAGCIFADKGPAIFVCGDNHSRLLALLGLTNSRVFAELVALHMGAAAEAARSYEVGVIQRTPVPDVPDALAEMLGNLALQCVEMKRGTDTANATSHSFRLPALLQIDGVTFTERLASWREQVLDVERQFAEHLRKIDDIASRLYGIEGVNQRAIKASLNGEDVIAISDGDNGAEAVADTEREAVVLDSDTLAADLLSYAVGCIFGRWDTRIALDPSLAPKLADPFAPLPVCSPGMLVGLDGLPASNKEISVMNADGSGRRQLTTTPVTEQEPTWSPDGSQIAFAADASGTDATTDLEIWVMNANGSGLTQLTNNAAGVRDTQPAWSPLGNQIAFLSEGRPDSTDGNSNIYVMDTNPATDDAADGTNRNIYVMDDDGGNKTAVDTTLRKDEKPDWQQDSIPPNTTITAGPTGITNRTFASFSFASSETGSTFRCSLSGPSKAHNFSSCSSPKAYSGLSDGTYTFRVLATDVAGNVDPTPDRRSFTVDTVAPTVKSVSPTGKRVSPKANATATFSEAMRPATLNTTTFKLVKKGATASVPAKITYSAATMKATLNPTKNLKAGATYKAILTTRAKDAAGNSLAATKAWAFKVKR